MPEFGDWSMLSIMLISTVAFQEPRSNYSTWWRHQMETFSALLAICVGNSPVPGEFPTQRPVMRSFDVFFDLGLNKRLSKQSWGWWFGTLSRSLWRHSNGIIMFHTALSLSRRHHICQTRLSRDNYHSFVSIVHHFRCMQWFLLKGIFWFTLFHDSTLPKPWVW